MLTALTLSATLIAPIPLVAAVAIAAAATLPLPASAVATVALAVVALRRGRDDAGAEGVFLHAVAAELRSGAVLRTALVEAAARTPSLELDTWVRRASAGVHLATLGGPLGARLPTSGRSVAAAIEVLADSGGSAATVFSRLAAQADDARVLQRERRAAGAQARLSAAVVAVLPVPVLAWLLARGSLAALTASTSGVVVLTAGVALELVGVAATAVLLRRGRR